MFLIEVGFPPKLWAANLLFFWDDDEGPLERSPRLDRVELLAAPLTRRSLSALQMAPAENINPIASEVLVEWNIYNGRRK